MDVLRIENLSVSFQSIYGQIFAVNDLSFKVRCGECVCIVGESGSGKSVTAKAIMKILDRNAKIDSGNIFYDSMNLTQMKDKEMRRIRGKKIALVHQTPRNALNPSYTIYKQMQELYRLHGDSRKDYRSEIISMLKKVRIHLPEKVIEKYPFELSGGMLQRIVLAMACSQKPDLIIADEPTSALDVSTQAQILLLLKELAKEFNCAILLITHDMGVVAEMADRILVMYCGRKMEERNVDEFFKDPLHPYTQGLLNARPQNFNGRFNVIQGNIPENFMKYEGCEFYERCPNATEYCRISKPTEKKLKNNGYVRCFYAKESEGYAES